MSQQVTVRLPDELVALMDEQVDHGEAASRAAVVTRAMRREVRRAAAARDAAVLATVGRDHPFESLAVHASRTNLDID